MTAATPQATEAPTRADLFLLLYCLVDDLYRELVPDDVRLRPGHTRMALSDSEVITLSLMQEALSIDSEVSFVRALRREHADLFPGLIERSRYHRRRKALVDVQRALFARVAGRLAAAAAWLVVDSAPVETTAVERSQTGARSIPEASYHVRAARKQLFFGFRLHLTITDEGAVAEFALAPANEPERAVAEAMLAAVAPAETGLVLGDANYTGAEFRRRLAARGHALWASPKRGRPAPDAEAKRWRRWVRGHRVRVEVVLAMLADQFRVETTRARSLAGVWTRVVAKVLAFDLSLVINRLLGRSPLALKSLYL